MDNNEVEEIPMFGDLLEYMVAHQDDPARDKANAMFNAYQNNHNTAGYDFARALNIIRQRVAMVINNVISAAEFNNLNDVRADEDVQGAVWLLNEGRTNIENPLNRFLTTEYADEVDSLWPFRDEENELEQNLTLKFFADLLQLS